MAELAPIGAREMRAIFETAAQGNLDDRYARATVSQQHTRALEPMLPDERRRRAARGPTLRSLVRLARQCDSAEQLGQQLKRRYDRSLQRRGMTLPGRPTAADLAEIEQLIGEP